MIRRRAVLAGLLGLSLSVACVDVGDITPCSLSTFQGQKTPLDTRSDCAGAGRILGEQGDDAILGTLVSVDGGDPDANDPDAGDGGGA